MRSMTPEERFERIEAQLGFLASQVAQTSASLETVRLSLESLRDVAVRHDTQIVQLTDVVVSLARIVEEQGRRTDERLNLVAEFQRHTDERLNTLINVVERYFSNGRH